MKIHRFMVILVLLAAAVFTAIPVFAAGEAQEILLRKSGKSKLFLLTPPGGGQKDSLLMLELNEKTPYKNGYRHGRLLADNIADIISNRYNCISQDVLDWTQDAYYKMPRDFQNEIRGIADGLAKKGYNFPFAKIILHATQPFLNSPVSFPWFECPWDEGSSPTGSFSYAVWGRYTPTGTALAINSPDWGAVPRSLARNRVLVSVRRGYRFRYAYLGVAGVVGMSGANETRISISGTAGHPSVTPVTAMPGNGVPIPEGFMSPFIVAAHVLRNFSGTDPAIYEKFEEILRVNPSDGLILQVTTPTGSALWESGAAASPEYPHNSRRMAGEWDAGNITPVDWRGDLLLLPGSVLRISALPFPVAVDYNDSTGDSYAGRAWPDGIEIRWQRRPLGRAFSLPSDIGRGARFSDWFANLGTTPVAVPYAVSNDGSGENGVSPHIISTLPDKTGGWWVLADGSGYGFWLRDGDSAFRAFGSDSAEVCSGPLYDFGNGVTGWCALNSEMDIEWVAWTHQYPDGADNRLDAMNLSLVSAVKPWARMSNPFFGGPHSRTHFLLRELGAPKGTLSLEEFYKIFQRAYFSVGGEDQPAGVGAYDLALGDALFTVSRYEGDTYIGGLAAEQIPIKLNRIQLFGR